MESLKKGATKEDLEKSQASVSMAQASYDNAKASLGRSQTLYQSGAEAQSDLDQAKLDFANAEAKLKQAQADGILLMP
ncbi:TolC family protein [Desulfosporosinus sp. SYSU MS00001]|uniref:TolC family protein n=1 Tax=Desulfosporosinus sp. SYSU MS00001 TaxID=3416284 RepID=UPI003CEE190E